MENSALYAQAFQYPYPGLFDTLSIKSQNILAAPGGNAFARFVEILKSLSISQQEELYTRTLDLSPLSAPYVGYHIWGESYQRGEFLASLNREMMKYEIDLEGELPDHLLPILRYLNAEPSPPLPDLLENLDQALASMTKSLRKAEGDNPYLHLFEALRESFGGVTVES